MNEIISLAVEWVEQQQKIIQRNGKMLSTQEITIARQVGVVQPTLIYIMKVDEISPPDHPVLRQVANQLNFLGPDTIGFTLGYGVYLRKGYVDDRLLSHEFRHVRQYEIAGSIAAFIDEYIRQIFQYGYLNALYEVDARAYEITD
jgi:hypothetical protein